MQTKQQCSKKLFRHLMLISVFFMLLGFNSCLKHNEDYENELCIINGTGDTIFFATEPKRSFKHYYLLRPYEYYSYCKAEQSVFDVIKEEQRFEVKIKVYKLASPDSENIEIYDLRTSGSENKDYYRINPNPLVTWEPPLITENKNVHSFYNTNSWEFTKGGIKCKWDIATFTITEDDFNLNR